MERSPAVFFFPLAQLIGFVFEASARACEEFASGEDEQLTLGRVSKKKRFGPLSGQIIATSHDLTPKGSLVMGIPLFQGNPGW